MRQTPARLFNSQDDMFVSSPQLSHKKNARSFGDALYMARSPSPPVAYASKQFSTGIARSESSPTVSPMRFQAPTRERTPSPEVHYFHPDEDTILPRGSHGHKQVEGTYHGSQYDAERRSRSPAHQSPQSSTRSSPPRPSRMTHRDQYAPSRNHPQSPTKTLANVPERDEFDFFPSKESLSPPPVPPKKRSRSPMKKMFGEHGWLGQSPNEKPAPKIQPKKSFVRTSGDLPGKKKPTMIGRLKSKLEEIVSLPTSVTGLQSLTICRLKRRI